VIFSKKIVLSTGNPVKMNKNAEDVTCYATCSYITLIIAHVKKYYNDKALITPSYDYPA
jgi:hypothetical protein